MRARTAIAAAQLEPQLPPWLPYKELAGNYPAMALIAAETGDAAAGDEERFAAILHEEYGKTRPAGRVRLVNPEIPANALDLARKRFGLFINTVEPTP